MQPKQSLAGLSVILGLLAAPPIAACEFLQVDESAGLMRDRLSGLTWSRCLLGQDGPDCDSAAQSHSWVEALNQARASELGGITNWRLPRIEELLLAGACLKAKSTGLNPSIVWSSSANLDYATDAWAYDFAETSSVVNARDHALQVLLVASPN